jgi:hypothetical protein
VTEGEILGKLSYADLVRAKDIGESERLEFKSDMYQSKGIKNPVLKGIVALANTQGGNLIIGLSKNEKTKKHDIIGCSESVDDVKNKLHSWLHFYIDPPNLEYDVYRIDVPSNKHCIGIEVKKKQDKIYAIRANARTYQHKQDKWINDPTSYFLVKRYGESSEKLDFFSFTRDVFSEWVSSLLSVSEQTLALSAFERALNELGTEDSRILRKAIHRNFTDYTSLKSDYAIDGEKSVTLWIKQGEKVSEESTRISIEKLNKEIKHNDNLRYFEEIAVKIDRIGFMLYRLRVPQELRQSYLKWLCVMFCEIWNKLAPHVLLRRKDRFKEYQQEDEYPPPVLFVPYFEKLVYESYEYYYRELRDKAKIFCLNRECRTEVE